MVQEMFCAPPLGYESVGPNLPHLRLLVTNFKFHNKVSANLDIFEKLYLSDITTLHLEVSECMFCGSIGVYYIRPPRCPCPHQIGPTCRRRARLPSLSNSSVSRPKPSRKARVYELNLD